MNDPGERVDQLLTEFLKEQEEGRAPDRHAYLGRLDSEHQRREFEERLATIGWMQRRVPATIETRTVLAGRYELLEELGSGGFGNVWRATDRQLGQPVAVKLLKVMSSGPADLARYHSAELKALARLEHPGVVRIHAAGEHEGTPYLVMDLIRGRSLDAVLAELAAADAPPSTDALRRAIGAPCPPGIADHLAGDYYQSAARVVVEVLRTLEAAHAAQILHRDIKPANVMLTGGGHPVLLDFGMASLTDEATGALTGKLVGTANYLAPEQIRSHKIGRSALTDVYQVGLVLYEMLTLRPAFGGEQGWSTVPDRILHGEFARPREVVAAIPPELEAICECALQHVPERRFPSAAAFREILERWLESGTIPSSLRQPPDQEDPEPDDPGRYEVRKELLRNAYEVVQLAWDRVLDHEVVLKRAGPGLWSPHVRRRVKREARNLMKVDHPGIVRLHDVHEIGTDLVLVMEPLLGTPLQDRATGAMPVAEATRLGVALAEALQALHEAGIVHCCLGPETVWITDGGAPKVAGFAFARDVEGSTVSTIGFDRARPDAPAQSYMAPEQQAGHRPDARADVFALGCLLYRLLTGEDPDFDRRGVPDVRAVRRDVPRALSAAIAQCMHPARTRRFPTMLDVAAALGRGA